MKKIFEKINFRQPKYMLPAILYIPLLGASYFIFDLFHTETADIPDKTLQTTEFLNPELPEAQIKDDGIGSKYENMEKSWGKIQDYSAVGNIERDEPDENKEEYESQYTQDDIALLDEQQQEKAAAAEIAAAKEREQEALAELEKALAEARLKGQNMVMPPEEADTTDTVPPQNVPEAGTIDEIFYEPRHPYTWGLLSAMPDLDTADDRLYTIPGSPPNLLHEKQGDAFAPRNHFALNIDDEVDPPMFKISDTHYAATWLLDPRAPKVDMPPELAQRIARMRAEAEKIKEAE